MVVPSWRVASICRLGTWYNYETGCDGPRGGPAGVHRPDGGQSGLAALGGGGASTGGGKEDAGLANLTPIELIRRGLEKLEQGPSDVVVVAPENHAGRVQSPNSSAVSLVPDAGADQG